VVTTQTQYQVEVGEPTFGAYSQQRLAGQSYDLGTFMTELHAHSRKPSQASGRPLTTGSVCATVGA
jgi:hypothetical protein